MTTTELPATVCVDIGIEVRGLATCPFTDELAPPETLEVPDTPAAACVTVTIPVVPAGVVFCTDEPPAGVEAAGAGVLTGVLTGVFCGEVAVGVATTAAAGFA